MKKILHVKNLNVTFQSQGQELHAVRGIEFSLCEGESIGLIGESGCGKSAAAKALIKLLPDQNASISGEVWYKENNLLSFSEVEMRRMRGKEIGLIFQDSLTSLNPTLKVGSQIIEGYHKHFSDASMKEATEAAYDMLKKVGMPHLDTVMASYPHTLSGGMRQRAMIALSLICKPRILLADEPTTALDMGTQTSILDFLKQQQKETKMGILLITHDMSLAANFCDRVMVMYGGKIVESAPAAELFSNPQHPYTRGLMKTIPQRDKKVPLIPIEGTPPDLTLPLRYCSFCSRCPDSMNICAKNIPPLFPVAEFHWSACFKNDPRCKR